MATVSSLKRDWSCFHREHLAVGTASSSASTGGCLNDCVSDCVAITQLTAYRDCVGFCGKTCKDWTDNTNEIYIFIIMNCCWHSQESVHIWFMTLSLTWILNFIISKTWNLRVGCRLSSTWLMWPKCVSTIILKDGALNYQEWSNVLDNLNRKGLFLNILKK